MNFNLLPQSNQPKPASPVFELPPSDPSRPSRPTNPPAPTPPRDNIGEPALSLDPKRSGAWIPAPNKLAKDPTYQTANQLTPGQAYAPLRQVKPQETVQGQMTSLLNSANPYMKHARLRGTQYANSRGLLSSSLGAQAAEQAAVERALPIAQQDAETHAAAAGANQQALLDTGLANLDVDTRVGLANLDVDQRQYAANLDAQTRTNLANLDAQMKHHIAVMDNETRFQVENLGGRYRVLLARNEDVRNAWTQMVTNIANIMTTNNLNDAGKRDAVNDQFQHFERLLHRLDQSGRHNQLPTYSGLPNENSLKTMDLSQYF